MHLGFTLVTFALLWATVDLGLLLLVAATRGDVGGPGGRTTADLARAVERIAHDLRWPFRAPSLQKSSTPRD